MSLPFQLPAGIPGLPGGIPGLSQPPAPQTSSGAGKDATKLQPYLNLCNAIKEKQQEIQDALVSKIKEVFLNDVSKLNMDTKLLYNKITDLTSNLVIDQIKSMFTADNKNARIMAFKLAKDAYMDTKPVNSIFSATTLKDYNDRYNDQLMTYLDTLRKTVSTGGSVQFGGDAGIDEMFNKLYGDDKFQKTILNMVTTKIEKIIQDKEFEQILLENIRPTMETAKNVINEQLNKLFGILNNNKVMNMFMIKALGDEYIKQYFRPPAKTVKLEQYIDNMTLSKAQIVSKAGGGNRRKTKRRQYKCRRQTRSAKNIA